MRSMCHSERWAVSERPRRGTVRGQLQLSEGGPDDSRDVHLSNADDLADLGLREIFAEAQMQHESLASGKSTDQPVEQDGVFSGCVTGVLDRDFQSSAVRFAVVVARLLERDGVSCGRGLHRFKDFLDGPSGGFGELGHRG